MVDDKTKGAVDQAKGSIKEAIGMLIGDRAVEAEGAAEKAAGRAQHEAATRPRAGSAGNEPQ